MQTELSKVKETKTIVKDELNWQGEQSSRKIGC